MYLLGFTTPDDIRAVLGVNDVELKDDTLLLSLYADHLATELDDISLTLASRYKQIAEKAEETRTEDEKRLLRSTGLFATYTVAKQLAGSLSMFAPKSVSDSKAEVSRFADPYKDTKKDIKTQWELYKGRVTAALSTLETLNTRSAPRTIMLVSTPSVDATVAS